jgi:nucleoside diphosphate kinase
LLHGKTWNIAKLNEFIFDNHRIFFIDHKVWEGTGAVVTGRKMLGATKPADSAPGTIRGDFAIEGQLFFLTSSY